MKFIEHVINHKYSSYVFFLCVTEIVCSAIGESVPVQDAVKPVTPGAISAGVSTVSGCTAAVIGELEGWGSLWTLRAEGKLHHSGIFPLISIY